MRIQKWFLSVLLPLPGFTCLHATPIGSAKMSRFHPSRYFYSRAKMFLLGLGWIFANSWAFSQISPHGGVCRASSLRSVTGRRVAAALHVSLITQTPNPAPALSPVKEPIIQQGVPYTATMRKTQTKIFFL
jgi:hypothetical protein